MQRAAAFTWHTSLVTRLAFLWALLAAAVVAVSGFLTYWGNREHLVQVRHEDLRHDMEMAALRMQSGVSAAMHDVLFLSRAPLVRECLRQLGKPEEERSRTMLEGELRALMEGRPSYTQMRLIGGTNQNGELVNLRKQDKMIARVHREPMQPPLAEDVVEATRLMPGDVFISKVGKSHSAGSEESQPTVMLRMLAKVSADHESVSGVLVLDMDLGLLFSEMQATTSKGVQLVVADAMQGDYFLRPEGAGNGGTTPANLFAEYAEVRGMNLGERKWLQSNSGDEQDLFYGARLELFPESGREVFLGVGMPATQVFAGMDVIRSRALGATFLTLFLAVLLILLLARVPALRLKRVTAAVERYQAGELLSIQDQGNDELGVLARRFEEMAQKVRSQISALEVARQEAEEATRVKEEFLAVVSHEIRTPMNAVFGLIRVLERSRPAAHQEPVLASLRTAAKHLLSLLNDALDYTKLKTGRLEFERADFRLWDVFADVALTHRPLAMQKGVELEFEPAPDLPTIVSGDSVRLTQILNNLISNALKFTEAGFVRVRAKSDVSSNDGNLRVLFEVEDSGIGVAPEDRERIFAPFLRAQAPKARKIDGAGLGLHITRTLIEMQGGELRLESTVGEGSCFTAVLPFGKPEQPILTVDAADGTFDSATLDLSNSQILYVEDIASNREVMSVILEDTGATLVCATTGAEALEELAEREFHALLADLQLPDMSGLELAELVRKSYPSLPIIAVTAQCSAQTADECLKAGMSATVTKPIDPAILFQALMRVGVTSTSAPKSVTPQLDELFGRDPDRYRRVLTAVAQEMRDHRRVLRQAFGNEDSKTVREVRHKMHSAIEQLSLHQLRASLEEALAGNPQAQERCLQLLDQTAATLESRAEALN